jgi:hypothetical protein
MGTCGTRENCGPGQYPDKKLLGFTKRADIFQLFWSENVKQSLECNRNGSVHYESEL